MKFYYAEENVIYDENGNVMMALANVGFRKWVAKRMARLIADHMNDYEADNSDVLMGSLH